MGLQKRFNLTAASSSALGGVLADPAKDTDTIPCRIKDDKLYITPPDSGQTFVLKAATLAALGGIKAGPKTEDDTVVVHIGEDQQLYVTVPKPFTLTAATAAALGGIKAKPKTDSDTVAAHIGPDQQLYVPAPTVPNMPHLQVVSYVGTGASGRYSRCELSAGFPIKAIIALTPVTDRDDFRWPNGGWGPSSSILCINLAYVPTTEEDEKGLKEADKNGGNSVSYGWTNKTKTSYYWYNLSGGAKQQLNETGVTYSFLLVG